jgi:hypothetical protein
MGEISYVNDLMQNVLSSAGLKGVLYNQINLYAKQICKVIFESNELEKAGRLGKGDQHIQVNAQVLLLPDIRTEKSQ